MFDFQSHSYSDTVKKINKKFDDREVRTRALSE